MTSIALFGAGGKMGSRCTDNLKDSSYNVKYVEASDVGLKNLARRGLTATPPSEALKDAGAVVLAVPDNMLGRISAEIAPQMKSCALLITLDPAASCAGKLFMRPDLSYFVAHPCHPPIFNDEIDLEAKRDFYGGIKAKQHIVCALAHGAEEAYARGVEIARQLFKPVMRAHRITVEQMAILEPALVETTSQTCLLVVREALDEAIELGVPPEAARDFLMGHLNIQLAIFFNEIDVQFSDGAKKAMDRARSQIIQPDWKRVFELAQMQACLEEITREQMSEVRGQRSVEDKDREKNSS